MRWSAAECERVQDAEDRDEILRFGHQSVNPGPA
jgi:hypothetical protein